MHVHDPMLPTLWGSCKGQGTTFGSSLLSLSGFWGLNLDHLIWQQAPLPPHSPLHSTPIFLNVYFHFGQFWGSNPGLACSRQVPHHWCNPPLFFCLWLILPVLFPNATFYTTLPVFIPCDCISQEIWNSIYCGNSISCPWLPRPPSSLRVLFLLCYTIRPALITASFFS